MRTTAAQVPDEKLSARLQLQLAEWLAQRTQWAEAIAEYQAWLAAFDGNEGTARALAGLGNALWAAARPEEAAAALERGCR